MKRFVLITFIVLISACEAPGPRNEVLGDTTFAVDTDIEVVIERTRRAGEGLPIAEQIAAQVMTIDSLRVELAERTVKVGDVSTVKLRFHVPRTSSLELTVDWGAPIGRTVLHGLVAEFLDRSGDTTITFSEPMDHCETVQRAIDHTFCEQTGTVRVYGPSGAFEQSIAGRELRVLGREVWISQPTQLTHWTDVASEPRLRFDGAVQLLLAPPWGETTPGRALRATTTGLVIVTWDGTTLSSREIEGFPSIPKQMGIFEDGDDFMLLGRSNYCRVKRGCPTEVCEPAITCETKNGLALDGQHVWFFRQEANLGIAEYRLRSGLAGSDREVTLPGGNNSFAQLGRTEDFVFNQPVWRSPLGQLIPKADELTSWLQLWEDDGTLMSATQYWLISRTEPFTLRFHQLQ